MINSINDEFFIREEMYELNVQLKKMYDKDSFLNRVEEFTLYFEKNIDEHEDFLIDEAKSILEQYKVLPEKLPIATRCMRVVTFYLELIK